MVNTNNKRQNYRNTTAKTAVMVRDRRTGEGLKPIRFDLMDSVQDAEIVHDTDATWNLYQAQQNQPQLRTDIPEHITQYETQAVTANHNEIAQRIATQLGKGTVVVVAFGLQLVGTLAVELLRFGFVALRSMFGFALRSAQSNLHDAPSGSAKSDARQHYDMRNNQGNININNHFY
ncbi:MAG: hypothetical protein ACPGXZ_06590 [Saprospiraceae bacterium]